MSFDAKNINPIDFKKYYAVGINLPFSAPAVFNSNYTTQEAIKNNLSNFFLTNVGERYLFPTFEGNLRATLFEQTSTITVESLKELISISLEEFFSTVQVVELEVLPNEEQQQLVVLLRYNIIDTGISDNLELTFE